MARVGDEVLSQFEKKEEVAQPVCTGKKLRVGIIGTGWIAESHIESYKRMPDVEIVAGADLIPGKAEAFFKRYGVEGVHLYPDHKSMLDNEELGHEDPNVALYMGREVTVTVGETGAVIEF